MGWTFTISKPGLVFRLLGALAFSALAIPAHASVTDFRLPPSESQNPQQPQKQGPVAPDVPESRGPLPEPTASRPPAQQPAPAPQVTPPPITATTSTPRPQPTRQGAQPTVSATAPSAVPTAPVETAFPTDAPAPSASATAPTASAPPVATTVPVRNLGEDEGGSIWPWVLAGLALIGALGFAALVWTRTRSPKGIPLEVPQLERPNVTGVAPPVREPAPDPAPQPAVAEQPPAPVAPAVPPPPGGEPVQVALEPVRLSLTLINATLAYKLMVTNHGTSPLSNVRIGADMISAHASMSREDQLAGPNVDPAKAKLIESLAPGETREVSGEFRVPFNQIVPIRQGNAALLLPLARFRVEAEGVKSIVRTFVVGQPGAGANLQPFRLDQGPRIYPHLAQKAFA